MAKVFPGGSSVTRVFPPSLAGGGGADAIDDAWYQEYFVDFTAQANGSIDHDDTFPELGVRADGGTAPTWLAEEDDVGADDDDIGTLEWVDQGLKLLPLGTSSNVDSSINAPCLSVALTDCIPNLTQHDVICVQVFCEEPVTIAAAFDGYGLAIYKPETNLTSVRKWVYYRNFYYDSGRSWAVSGVAGSIDYEADPGGIGTVPRMLEMVFHFSGGVAVCATSTSTSVTQTPLAATSNRGYCRNDVLGNVGKIPPPTWDLAADSARLGLYAFNVNSGTDPFYNYVSAVRILRLAGRAGGAD